MDITEKNSLKPSSLKVLSNAAVLPLMIFLLYYSISLLDLWGYAPNIVQGVGSVLSILLIISVFVFGLIKHFTVSNKAIAMRLSLCTLMTALIALWSGDDFLRLTTLAFKPRAYSQYDEVEIIATLTSPLYLGHDTVKRNMHENIGGKSSLNPIYEGSVLDVHVRNTLWRPVVKLSDGSTINFEDQDDGSFKASVKIDRQISWAVNQGSYTLGAWPIILIEDQAPIIKNFTLEEQENEKGYLALNVNIQDDHKIMGTRFEIVQSGNNVVEQHNLSSSGLKAFEYISYVDFTSSPFSGKIVDIKLFVEDEAGQVSTALLSDIKLPEKTFRHPLAYKLDSLRNELNEPGHNLKALSRQVMALGLLSEKENLPAVYFMSLRSAYWRLIDPANANDPQIAKDLLWDVAVRIENGDVSTIENDLVAALDDLNFSIKKKNSIKLIREDIRNVDQIFKKYSRAMRRNTSNLYSLDIDFRSLRKLYSYILSFSDKEKYYNASTVVDVLRKGIVNNNELLFSQDGLGNYFALSEGRQIIENIISIQKTLLASSYNAQMMESRKRMNRNKQPSKDITKERIVLQSKIGEAVKLLGEKISFTGMSSEFLIQNASKLIENILVSMKTDELKNVTQTQTELIAVMSNLKRLLNKPSTQSPELINIIEEINSQPVL